MKSWLFALCLMLVCTEATAEWRCISLDELVDQSDLIAVGTLVDVEESSDGTTDTGKGRIKIEEILKGPDKLIDRTLFWRNPTGLSCPRVEHKANKGIKAIWLLELKEDGSVEANHPERFVDLKQRDAVKGLVK